MIRIGIYDEDRAACERTFQCIMEMKKNPDITVLQIDVKGLLSAMEECTFDFHILVLEVISSDLDMIRMVTQINRKFPDCQIIYLTDQKDYVSWVYETEHCYFIWKWELEQVMPLALGKALKHIEMKEIWFQYLKIVCDRKHLEIPICQILYIERLQHRCRIVTFEGEYESYLSLKQLISQLPNYFVRCHTGYLVNGKYIVQLSGKMMEVGRAGEKWEELPIGRNYAEGVKEVYQKYSWREAGKK